MGQEREAQGETPSISVCTIGYLILAGYGVEIGGPVAGGLRASSCRSATPTASERHVSVDLASAHDIEIAGPRQFADRVEALDRDLVFATEAERAVVPGLAASWVIKLGARGASFPEGRYPAPAASPIDTRGAGDALAAGYLIGGPELALSAAARSVGLVGAMPADALPLAG